MSSPHFDVAVIGGGSAAEALARELDGSGLSMVVFEPRLVGGECPFLACMPSKAMLHDARAGATWDGAVARRGRITGHLDDSGHAAGLAELGVELVRRRAEIVGASTIRSGGEAFDVDHIVVATGARPDDPGIEGLDLDGARVWTSEDALVADELPRRLVIVGAGVIGAECATLFAGFGSEVHVVDPEPRMFGRSPERIGELAEASLRRLGVALHLGSTAAAARVRSDAVELTLSDGAVLAADRVLVAAGRSPETTGIGLERVGVDPDEPLPVEPNLRLRAEGSVWAIGDVAGLGQYTHLANHHAAVVADHLAGSASRRSDDVVVPRCAFVSPPVIEVGPTRAELDGDPDVVSVGHELAGFPRATTDDLDDGHLWVAARRSTGCAIAAAGIGPGFDELAHALVTAIDGGVPVDRLRRSMQPFPTVGEILGPIWRDLHGRLGAG